MDRKIIFIALLFITLSFNIEIASAAITAAWGDVVDVKYSLWYDAAHTQEAAGNIDVTLTYIYLSNGSNVPSEVSSLYPEANPNYIQAFKAAVIGLEVNGEKEFVITKEEQPQDNPNYGESDLYYHIELVRLWYDANPPSSTSDTTVLTTKTTTTMTPTTTTTTTTTDVSTSIPVLSTGFTYLTILFLVWPRLTLIRKRR